MPVKDMLVLPGPGPVPYPYSDTSQRLSGSAAPTVLRPGDVAVRTVTQGRGG